MCQQEEPVSRIQRWPIVLLLVAALALAGCDLVIGPPTPTPGIPTPALGSQQIILTSPTINATVTSPIRITGTTAVMPFERVLNFRLFGGPSNGLLAQGTFTTQGEMGGPNSFEGSILYTLGQQSPGRIEVFEESAADGSIRAIASLPVTLEPAQSPEPTGQPSGPSPTALPPPSPSAQQQILLDSPPPGTLVGSPVVITGRTVKVPAGSNLSYFLRDAGGAVLGSGTFPVSPTSSNTGIFNASITFNLPPNGGVIGLEVFEPGPAGGPVVSSSTLQLQVAPPQAILIDSPPPGTVVGSPVVITGRTARYPFQGNLAYRVLDAGNSQLGSGTFPVQGAQGGPTSFITSIGFNLPATGGRVTVEIVDQNAANGQIAAAARIDLSVAAQQQAIIIESPPANTLVGSPMTVTGRTIRLPGGNALTYRVRSASGQQIGQGQFGVSGTQDGGSRFNGQVLFTPPQGGGAIGLELIDIDPANGQVRASTTLQLQVSGPPSATVTPQPTTQSITIDTPPADTVVGSPVVITGRVALQPRTSTLNYVVRTLTRDTLGQGSFPVAAAPGQANIAFTASINFAEPAQGGAILVEIYDRDAVGNILASAIVQLQVSPRTSPVPTIPGGEIIDQRIVIDTPPPLTEVGSPAVITGRLALPPTGGQLSYQVLGSANNLLGEGSFTVPIPADAPEIPFVASITFAEPTATDTITIVITDKVNDFGTIRAEVRVQLVVTVRAYPQPRLP